MGDPAIPPEADRKATRELAAAIVQSVVDDEAMPLGLTAYSVGSAQVFDKDAVETLVFQLAQEITMLVKERAAYAETFNLACKLQDADQCEDHTTGDDCPQGDVEHQLYEHLSRVRTDDGRTDKIERGEKKRQPGAPSTQRHITNDHDDCVSWCPACGENRSRGLNPDGTAKA
jgi:hypothetical protein